MKFSIKSALIACLFFLTASATVSAQRMDRQTTPEQRAEREAEQLAQALELTDAQRAEISAINLNYAQKLEAAREEVGRDRDAMRTITESLREEQNAEFAAVLTDDQYAELLELQANPSKRQRGNRRGKK